MEIQADALKFETKKGRSHAELNFLGVATGADGEVHGRFSDALKLDFDSPSQAENLKGKTLHYEKEFKIAPGQYNLSVAFGQGESSFGKVQVPLMIDPWTGDLGLSGLALGRETLPASDLGLDLTLGDRTPLVAEGVQVVPSGSWQFNKSEPAFVYFEVYGAEASAARVRMRVLDVKTGEQKWDGGMMQLPPQNSGAMPSISLDAKLPVDSLPRGSYQLEVTATSSGGKQIKRTAAFETF
jgi:hypothetical protein